MGTQLYLNLVKKNPYEKFLGAKAKKFSSISNPPPPPTPPSNTITNSPQENYMGTGNHKSNAIHNFILLIILDLHI